MKTYRVTRGGINAPKLSDRQGYYIAAESPEQAVKTSGLLQPGATVDVEEHWTGPAPERKVIYSVSRPYV